MLVEGLVALMASNPALSTDLGVPRKDGTNGIFPNLAPDEVLLPDIVYMQMSRESIMSYQGVNRLQTAHFRFSCYGGSYKTAKIVARDLKLLLDGFHGLLPDGTNLQNSIPGLEVDDSEPDFKGTVYATHLDYVFIYIDNA